MNTHTSVRRLYLPLMYANRILLHAGGPEAQGELFDAEYELMEAILNHHHLPPLQQNLEYLFDFCDGDVSIDACEELLHTAGEHYLLSQPKVMREVIEAMRSGAISIHNGLIEMNVSTYVYSVFVCEQFCEGKTTLETVVKDIQLIEENPLLHELLMCLQTIDKPNEMLMYTELQQSGLSLYNRFLKVNETEDEIRIENLNILEVVGDAKMQAALLVQHDGFNEGVPVAVELEVAQLLKLVDVMIVDYLLENIMADVQDKKPAFAHVFKAEEYDVEVKITATCVLVPHLNNVEGGKSVPMYRLVQMIPDAQHGYCVQTKIEHKWRGDMPPEMV